MGDRRRAICKGCRAHRDDVGELSWTGLCAECGETRRRANFVGLTTKTGPEFVHWRRSLAGCVGGVLLDDVKAKP